MSQKRRNPSGHQIQPTARRGRTLRVEKKEPMTPREIHELRLRQRGVGE